MSEIEYASQRNWHFDDGLYADDGFIAELMFFYCTENPIIAQKITEFVIFHKHGKLWNWLIFNVEFASVKRRFSVVLQKAIMKLSFVTVYVNCNVQFDDIRQ